MSASTKKSWWVTQPGALMNAQGGGVLTGLAGIVLGVLSLTYALAAGLVAMLGPTVGDLAVLGTLSAIAAVLGVALVSFGESYFARWFRASARTSVARMALAVRAAVAASLVVGFGATLTTWVASALKVDRSVVPDVGFPIASLVLVLALTVGGLLSQRLLRLEGLRWQRAAIGWAGFTALLLVTGLAFTGFAWFRTGDLALSVSFSGRWMGWTLSGSALAVLMAASARKRLSIWDGADRWRDATLTPDLRLVFADGSGSRAASAYFSGYSGPVVVMPTAAEAGSVFRGDGAPADGWVVPGTRAALEEAVRCSRAMAAVTVAAVALIATAPLAVWLVSLIG